MRRVRFSVAMSLGGYIAGPNGENDWIVMDRDIGFSARMGAFDTVVLGRKTYEATRRQGSTGGIAWHGGVRLLAHSQSDGLPECHHVRQSCRDVGVAQGTAGKRHLALRRGSLFRRLLKLGLVDSVEVAVIPILLGGGLPLLPQPANQSKLRLVKHRVYEKTGTVALEYGLA